MFQSPSLASNLVISEEKDFLRFQSEENSTARTKVGCLTEGPPFANQHQGRIWIRMLTRIMIVMMLLRLEKEISAF